MSENNTDAMILRLEKEIEERDALMQGIVGAAQDTERDLTPTENELLADAKKRIQACEEQLGTLYESRTRVASARERTQQVSREMSKLRREVDKGVVEYRTAGAWIADYVAASNGSKEARERMEMFYRVADHQLTSDNLGVIPDPIVGGVIDFIDATRPLVSAIGPQALPSGTFYRPRVTQHTEVARQTDGTTDDITEKVELASQKMLISRLTVNAETYGGYVNVSRQNIDWSSPNIMDIIVNDLAAQYAITTEEVVADALATTQTAAVQYPLNPDANELAAAIWTAMGTVYSVTKGQGRPVLGIAPDRLGDFGPLFAPYNPQSSQGSGFLASNFGNGVMGTISGVPVVVSSALDSGEAFLFSTAAIEVYEQRIGSLSVTEPSVLGVQVAYAGYFATLIVTDDAIVPLEEGTS